MIFNDIHHQINTNETPAAAASVTTSASDASTVADAIVDFVVVDGGVNRKSSTWPYNRTLCIPWARALLLKPQPDKN